MLNYKNLSNFEPKTLFIGKNSVYLPSCHSTNDVAAEIIQHDRGFDGTIVITDHQTAGRGQRGNSWETLPNQNITASFILKPEFLKPNEQFRLNIAVSLAIHDFLASYIRAEELLKIKWSNDVYFGNKKMGGVLIENSITSSKISYSVIGIGLNINQLHFENTKATSLKIASMNESDFEIKPLIEQLCVSLEKEYFLLKNGGYLTQKKRYLAHLFRLNELHYFKKNDIQFIGEIIDVSEIGRLIIKSENGIEEFDFKEVSFVI